MLHLSSCQREAFAYCCQIWGPEPEPEKSWYAHDAAWVKTWFAFVSQVVYKILQVVSIIVLSTGFLRSTCATECQASLAPAITLRREGGLPEGHLPETKPGYSNRTQNVLINRQHLHQATRSPGCDMTTERLSIPCQFHEVLKRKAPRGSPGGKDLAAILQCLLLCMVCVVWLCCKSQFEVLRRLLKALQSESNQPPEEKAKACFGWLEQKWLKGKMEPNSFAGIVSQFKYCWGQTWFKIRRPSELQELMSLWQDRSLKRKQTSEFPGHQQTTSNNMLILPHNPRFHSPDSTTAP